MASSVGAQPGAMRYSVTFLNTKFLAVEMLPGIGYAGDLRGRPGAIERLLLRPDEVLSGIAHPAILEVAHHALRVLLQHRHVITT
jgi:hypothetical protein